MPMYKPSPDFIKRMEKNLKDWIDTQYHFDKLIESGLFYEVILHDAKKYYCLDDFKKEDVDRLFGDDINIYIIEKNKNIKL
jgi:hypothetical protein